MAGTQAQEQCLPDRHNWRISLYFTRQEFEECLKVVEVALEESGGLNEYPLYIKGMILRQQGKIQESLQLFQSAACLNPANITNLKQVGHSLFLLGKHKAALDVYRKALDMTSDSKSSKVDWEIWHNSGLCHSYLKQYDKAIDSFNNANMICRHEVTFMQLGKAYQQQGRHKEALKIYQDALDFSPENHEVLCNIGLAYLHLNDHERAFDYLGNSLTFDPRNPKAILAAGSIIQDNGEMDVALHKYRVAAVQTPQSPQLWNNIGMALFGKGKHVAAISCLKRALYLDPFEWIVSFNLGLVHMHTKQYASAFHHLSTSVNLKGDYGATFVCLGIALSYLQDPQNAMEAFKKAISLDDGHMARLNYAILLYNEGKCSEAKEQFRIFTGMVSMLDAGDEQHREVFDRVAEIESALNAKG